MFRIVVAVDERKILLFDFIDTKNHISKINIVLKELVCITFFVSTLVTMFVLLINSLHNQ